MTVTESLGGDNGVHGVHVVGHAEVAYNFSNDTALVPGMETLFYSVNALLNW